MIPDGFQYFLDDFWNFQQFSQSLTFAHFILGKMLQKYKNKYGHILKTYLFISHHFGNSKFPKMFDTTGHETGDTFYFPIQNRGILEILKM